MLPTLLIAGLFVFAFAAAILHHRRNAQPRNSRWASYKDEAWWVKERSDEDPD